MEKPNNYYDLMNHLSKLENFILFLAENDSIESYRVVEALDATATLYSIITLFGVRYVHKTIDS